MGCREKRWALRQEEHRQHRESSKVKFVSFSLLLGAHPAPQRRLDEKKKPLTSNIRLSSLSTKTRFCFGPRSLLSECLGTRKEEQGIVRSSSNHAALRQHRHPQSWLEVRGVAPVRSSRCAL